MPICEPPTYNKLWKLLIVQLAGISTNAMAKMGKGGDVSTQVLRKICIALDCKIEEFFLLTERIIFMIVAGVIFLSALPIKHFPQFQSKAATDKLSTTSAVLFY